MITKEMTELMMKKFQDASIEEELVMLNLIEKEVRTRIANVEIHFETASDRVYEICQIELYIHLGREIIQDIHNRLQQL